MLCERAWLGVWSRRVVTLFCPLRRKKRYGNNASWQRPHDAANSSRTPKVERKDQHLGPALRTEPHHGYQVAYTHYDQRCAHGSGKAQKHGSLACRRGGNCGVPAKNAAAPGRRDGLACARASQSSAVQVCIAACSGTAFHGYPPAKSKPLGGESLRRLKLAMYILTLPSCA